MVNFNDSTTIKAAKSIPVQMTGAAILGAIAPAAATAIALELNLPPIGVDILNTSVSKLVDGENLEAVGINILAMGAAYGLTYLAGKNMEKKIIKGRLKAKPIEIDTIPQDYAIYLKNND